MQTTGNVQPVCTVCTFDKCRVKFREKTEDSVIASLLAWGTTTTSSAVRLILFSELTYRQAELSMWLIIHIVPAGSWLATTIYIYIHVARIHAEICLLTTNFLQNISHCFIIQVLYFSRICTWTKQKFKFISQCLVKISRI